MKGLKFTQVRIMNTVYGGEMIFPVHTAVWCNFYLFIYFKYCIGFCTQLLLLHSSAVVNRTRWGWAGLSQEDMMEGGGGGVAMVMRVEHARSPLCCTPVKET